ncbi:response regulator [Halobacteriovorax sp. HLS]|uniref:response regulator n=1 Tax=Halobacteriovorax sp. HLS TaxID=2234000 RepID=UPI000FD89DAA|nr:response regulator [Halobacteriovorax sp. HLS]
MKLIIVDKNTLLRKTIKEELSYVGYDVVDKNDFDEVFSIIKSDVIDLVIVEASNEGFKLSQRIRSYEKDNNLDNILPIVFTAELDEIELRLESFRCGGNEFIVTDNKGGISYKINSILKPDLIWNGSSIAIVEDDNTTAKFLTYLLKSKGASVNWFNSAVDCYEFLKKESVDLIVTDFVMPLMTGTELVKKIRIELGLKDLPIVFTSSTKEKSEILGFYKCGGNDFISKPFLKEEVFTKIKILLDNTNKTKMMNQYIRELSNLNDVKDQFLAVCSHDLRAPLNSIIGYSDVLIEDNDLDSDVTDMIRVMNKSAHSLLGMVDDLLTLSEVQLKNELDLKEIDLAKIVEESFEQLKGAVKKKISFNIEDKSEHAIIYGNDSMLRRIFSNLLSNAYKFTEDGGEISSRIWCEEGIVYCTIQDSGIGIPQKYLNNVFVRMSGAGRYGLEGQKSTGIGLSIVKEIVDKHKATIEIDSEEGKGTVFTLGFELKKGA